MRARCLLESSTRQEVLSDFLKATVWKSSSPAWNCPPTMRPVAALMTFNFRHERQLEQDDFDLSFFLSIHSGCEGTGALGLLTHYHSYHFRQSFTSCLSIRLCVIRHMKAWEDWPTKQSAARPQLQDSLRRLELFIGWRKSSRKPPALDNANSRAAVAEWFNPATGHF